jgi:hypothetical protein
MKKFFVHTIWSFTLLDLLCFVSLNTYLINLGLKNGLKMQTQHLQH